MCSTYISPKAIYSDKDNLVHTVNLTCEWLTRTGTVCVCVMCQTVELQKRT